MESNDPRQLAVTVYFWRLVALVKTVTLYFVEEWTHEMALGRNK